MQTDDVQFSKKSKRAIILFIVLLFIIVIIPRIYSTFKPKSTVEVQFSDSSITRFHPIIKFDDYKRNSFKKRFKLPPTKFDPNTYSISDWMNLGLTQKQAIAVLKFGKYGFKSNQQLEKVFVIPKELFSMIKDSTFYSSNSNSFIKSTSTTELKEVKKAIQIELNTASESELITIPGIGPFFASNIIKQREKLGGFFQLEQLLDIWKFSPELIEQIKPYVTINPNNLRTLNINTASVVEIKAHPYMTWNIANSIVKIRKQKGNFTSINEIKESVLVSEELFNKLKPYLTL